MNKKPKKEGISLKDAEKQNMWKIIPIDKLPEDCPVFVVTEYASKDLAKFFLGENVLYPIMKK